MVRITRITIVRETKPKEPEINKEIMWLGKSLGLFSERDKEKSCYRIFITLLKNKDGMTSDELAEKANLSRGTIVHHLHRLIASGLVITQKNRYILSSHRLKHLIEDLERDTMRMFQSFKAIAEDIDNKL